jgi:fibronectin-binding autotransporter adhesin
VKNRRLLTTLFGSSLIFTASAHAGDVIKANNTTALNVAGSWTTAVPTATDVAVWNSTVLGANNSSLGGSLSWQGIRIANPVGAVTITGGAGNVLSLGSAGIDMSAATQNLTFAGTTGLALTATQTWNIGSGRQLTFGATGATNIDLAGNTLNTSGAGNIVIANRYSLTSATAATINVNNASFSFESGGSTAVSIAANITTNVAAGKVFQLRGNSGSGNIGVTSNGVVNVNGGIFRIQSSNTVQVNQTGKVNMSGTSEIDNQYGNDSVNSRLQLSGGLDVTGTMTWKETNTSTTATIFNSALTGNGTINFQNTTTTRRADWSGINSAFTGTVNINGATGNRNLRLTTSTAGSSLATWAPAAGNTLEVHGVAVNLGTLNGAGTVTNSHASNVAAITVGAGSFSGAITNGFGMSLTKNTGGTLTLSGANNYTGLTDVQVGKLSTTSAQTGGGAVTVADNATFGVTQLSNGNTFNVSTLTMGSAGGSTLELTPAAAPSVALVTAGTFTVNGTTTLSVKGLPMAGTTLVSYTTLNGSSGFGGLSLAMPFRVNGTLNNTGSAITLATVQDETPKWGIGDGVWDINTTSNWKTSATSTPTNYLQGGVGATDTVIFDDTSSGTSPITVTLNSTVSPVAIAVAGTKDYIISGSGTIAGTAGITKAGAGKFTISSGATYTGGTTVNEGRLTLVNTKTGSANFVTNAELEFNVTTGEQQINGGTFSGTGNLIKSGAGLVKLGGSGSPQAVSLTGANSIIDVQGGVLRNEYANSAWGANKAGLKVATGATFDVWDGNTTVDELTGSGTINKGWSFTNTLTIGVNNGSGDFTGTILNNASLGYGGQTGGALSLIKNGTGTQTLSGANTYEGGTTLNQGTITVGTGGTLGATTGALAVNNNNTTAAGTNTVLNLSTAADTTVGSLSGTISTPTGGTNTATINNGGAGRNFTVNQTADATYAGVIAGDGAFTLGSLSNKTLTLSGANTYTGATTINGGTLKLNATGTINNTSGVSLGTSGTFDVSAKSGGYTVSNLSGSGTVKGALTVSTQLAIGNSPGTTSFANGLTLDSATYVYEMTGGATPGVGSADLGNVTGTLTINAGSILDLVELGTFTIGNRFTLFGYTTLSGTFDGLADGAEFNDDLANKWQIDYNDTSFGLNGGIGTSFVTITAVPEPGAALLGGLGLLALLRRRRHS